MEEPVERLVVLVAAAVLPPPPVAAPLSTARPELMGEPRTGLRFNG